MVDLLSLARTNASRNSSDLLPYVRQCRGFFTPLPSTAAQMSLQVLKVPVNDIECVTKTVLKVKTPMWYLKIKKCIDKSHRSTLKKY